MISLWRLIAACLCAAAFLVCPDVLWAQPAVSTLSGRVLDQNGEGASGAMVTAHNTATSAEWSAAAGADGRFVLQFLPPGTYEVEVTLAGFSTWRASSLVLGVGQDLHLDPRLRVSMPEHWASRCTRARLTAC